MGWCEEKEKRDNAARTGSLIHYVRKMQFTDYLLLTQHIMLFQTVKMLWQNPY